jgi:outer membrane protein
MALHRVLSATCQRWFTYGRSTLIWQVRASLSPGINVLTVPRRLIALALALAGAAACYPALPGAGGARPAAPAPSERWQPPAAAEREAAASHLAADTLPPPFSARRNQLTTTDLATLALSRSPETRASWLAAEAAAANYGDARSALFPTLTGSVAITRLKSAATSGRVSVEQTTYGPSLSLSWLLVDFGGRSGAIDAAASGLYAANWTHNAVISDLVRRTVQGYFAFVGARALLAAANTSLQESQVNLSATEDRRAVGVATIAEVLEARTAVSQARLAAQQDEGAAASARGALATLIGLPPDASFDVDTTEANTPIAEVSATVDSLMAAGLLERSDLAAERAQVDARQAQAREARSQFLPSLGVTGSASDLRVGGSSQSYPSYTVALALSVPIFNGLGWEYAARAASLTADAESERLRTMEQQVALQVYQTYQQLRTAAQSVATSEELYTSASASVDAALARYRQGVGSLLELVTAQSALADARSQRIQSRVAWHMALVQLAHDAGTLQPDGATELHLAPPSGRN